MTLRAAPAVLLLASLALAPFAARAEEKTVAPVAPGVPAVVAPGATPADALTPKPAKGPVYYRYETDKTKRGSGNFELLVRKFRHPETGREVTLAGMVHYADPAFYQEINKLADDHDVVLVEGVKGGLSFGSVPLIYKMLLAGRLVAPARLEGQQDHLKQDSEKYHNADVTLASMDQGFGETVGDYAALPFWIVIGESGYILEGVTEQLAFLTGQSEHITRGARDILASALAESEGKGEKDDAEEKRILLDRNDSVLKALDGELTKPDAKRILIPWGAAHHAGLEPALLERGFKPVSEEWKEAIAVANLNTSPDTDAGFRWAVPYALSLRFSATTDDVTGPLALLDYHDSPRIHSHSSAWGLLHYRNINDEGSSAAVLAGIGWVSSSTPKEDTWERYALLGLWGQSHTEHEDTTRLGWWGFLGGATDKHTDEGEASEWHLPITFGKYPLFYRQATDAHGVTERRFLLFFKTTSR